MDRAGQRRPALFESEIETIFAVVSEGGSRVDACRRLPERNGNTIKRAYNVVAEFQRNQMVTMDDATAQCVAHAARYATTLSYVQHLFLKWRVWLTRPNAPVAGSDGRESDALYLVVDDPQAGWWTHNGGEAFYTTINVRSVSPLERDCWASLQITDPPGNRFILHWAGVPYDISETEPVYVDITSDVPARLDVAFVLLPGAQGRYSQSSAQAQELYGGIDLQGLERWHGKGCWIAQQLALSSPNPDHGSYLKPGAYHIRLRIYCRTDLLAFEGDYALTSPEQPKKLQLRRLFPEEG